MTPAPTVSPPVLVSPEDGTSYNGAGAIIELAWSSNHTPTATEYFEVTVRYSQAGVEVRLPVYIQTTSWFASTSLLGRADQESGRRHTWSVRVVRQETGSDGEPTYVPLSPASQERTFYWLP